MYLSMLRLKLIHDRKGGPWYNDGERVWKWNNSAQETKQHRVNATIRVIGTVATVIW